MNSNQLSQLNEQFSQGRKFLRKFSHDERNNRLQLSLGRDPYDGSGTRVIIEGASVPEGLGKLVGQEIYGIRFYHHPDRTEVHIDFGPTITFTVLDEPETKPQAEGSKA